MKSARKHIPVASIEFLPGISADDARLAVVRMYLRRVYQPELINCYLVDLRLFLFSLVVFVVFT